MNLVENIRDYYNEETKVITMPKKVVDISPEGIGYVLFESLKNNSGKPAMIDLTKRETYTYDDLYIRTVRTAIKMKNLGIKPGDIISICSHNQIDSVSVFLSALLIGAINASLEPSLGDDDLGNLISQVSPKAFFVSTDCEKRIEGLCEKLGVDAKIVVFGESAKNLRFDDCSCSPDDEDSFEPYIPKHLEEMCFILFSSGSTGLPKAFCYSHKYYSYHTGNIETAQNSLTFSNVYWTGFVQTSMLQLRNGKTFIFASKFEPADLWTDIKTFNINFIQMYPHVAMEFIDNKPEMWDGELLFLAIMGSSASKENLVKIREAVPNTYVCNIYAMSETAQLTNPTCPMSYKKVTSIGVPLLGIQYKVVDSETEQNVGFNQLGELRVKSPYQLKGYYKRDSTNIWDEEGYFKTGDLVYYDEDFSFFFVDRIQEMFKYRGVHITPVKYEGILENHPDITMSVLVGIPHELEGCHIMAVVVPRKGSLLTPKQVEDYFNERVPEIAKIRAGVKIARKRVKEMVMKDIM